MDRAMVYPGLYRTALTLGRASLVLAGLACWIPAIFGMSSLCGWIAAGLCVDLRRMGGRDWWKPLLWGLPGVLLTPLALPAFFL